MQEFLPILTKCPLFDGIRQEDLSGMLSCLDARVIRAKKNRIILEEGEPAVCVGIVLHGSVRIVRDDYYGSRSIVASIHPGELFGESFACAGAVLPVSAAAAEDSTVMLIDCRRITFGCTSACAFHSRMIQNLLRMVANKNLLLNRKLEILSKRTTREKLMAFLTAQAEQQGKSSFTIPYDRQGLADYLGVDRSAMSAEISKLRRDGVLECERSKFTLL